MECRPIVLQNSAGIERERFSTNVLIERGAQKTPNTWGREGSEIKKNGVLLAETEARHLARVQSKTKQISPGAGP